MSLPHLLLVDDSEAVLAFEQAALAGHYQLSTASNGHEALERLGNLKPAAVLLDLSMPEMDGDEVLARMRAEPSFAEIPVIIVSSEGARAEACMRQGAQAFLAKPVRAGQLRETVGRVLEEAARRARSGNLAILPLAVGAIHLAVPLEGVRRVLHYLATRDVPGGPDWLNELFELEGEPVLVLDLARRWGLEHGRPPEERVLAVMEHGEAQLALCASAAFDPEEVPAADLVGREKLGGSKLGQLKDSLLAVAKTTRGTLPVVDPASFFEPALLEHLRVALEEATVRGEP